MDLLKVFFVILIASTCQILAKPPTNDKTLDSEKIKIEQSQENDISAKTISMPRQAKPRQATRRQATPRQAKSRQAPIETMVPVELPQGLKMNMFAWSRKSRNY